MPSSLPVVMPLPVAMAPNLPPPASQLSAHAQDAPWLFAGLLVLLVAVVSATVAESGLGPKAVAMLGVLAASGAALRPLGAGTAGIDIEHHRADVLPGDSTHD